MKVWRAEDQRPADVAVIVPTILRPSLERAVRSVFGQDLSGTILIGIDKPAGDGDLLRRLKAAAPKNVRLTILDLGYSTSRRHGGLVNTWSGGALRTMLSYAANSRYAAYLDDDNWWDEKHLSSLLETVQGTEWAYSKRWFVDAQSLERVRHRQNQKGDSQGSQKVIQAMSWVKGGQPWMTRPYSEDLRERVVRVVESGTSRNAAAKQFDVSISFVVKLMQRWKQRGTIKADKYGGWKKSKLAPHGDRIRALVMENCDITIDELCVLLAAEGIEAKRSTLGDFLLAQGLSRKKRQPTPPSRSALTSRRREPLGATSNLG